ncbi:hypothetical protein KM043_014897 [Ampulex compressa]|nr:hypothetical protein KM043_014897 [Ampulex compressa]
MEERARRVRGLAADGRGGVDGVDGAPRVALDPPVEEAARREAANPGNGKGRWVGARVCLNRDLRNLSLEFPVKD